LGGQGLFGFAAAESQPIWATVIVGGAGYACCCLRLLLVQHQCSNRRLCASCCCWVAWLSCLNNGTGIGCLGFDAGLRGHYGLANTCRWLLSGHALRLRALTDAATLMALRSPCFGHQGHWMAG